MARLLVVLILFILSLGGAVAEGNRNSWPWVVCSIVWSI